MTARWTSLKSGNVIWRARANSVCENRLSPLIAITSASRSGNAVLRDVGRQLGRSALETGPNGLDDGDHRVPQRLGHLVVAQHDDPRQPVDQAAALDFELPVGARGAR